MIRDLKFIIGHRVAIILAVGLALHISLSACFAQGSLTPPGAPGPMMKSLAQIEPRIPIHGTNLPLTISQPGSYYLAENITASAGGITISADNVTLDLMGFSLSGAPSDGIVASGTRKMIEVRNGTVSGCGGNGVSLRFANNSRVANLRAEGNTGIGIWVGNSGAVADCIARSNGSIGINTFPGSTIRGCTAELNGNDGIQVNQGSTVSGCTAKDNVGFGFDGSSGSTFTGCAAYSNDSDGFFVFNAAIIDCIADGNGDDGIVCAGGSVINCTCLSNTGDGIQVTQNTIVRGNNCNFNGAAGDGAGIHVTNVDNRIEANTVTANDRGIDVDSLGNLIIGNSARNNTTNYVIVTGNACLVISATTSGAISGNSGGVSPGTTNPWANFAY